MNSLIVVLLALAAMASAKPQPQYGYNNYFQGSYKPTQVKGWKVNCKVEWRAVDQVVREPVEECEQVKVKKTECKTSYKTYCEEDWVCHEYPEPADIDDCDDKEFVTNNYRCQKFKEDNCKDKDVYVTKCQVTKRVPKKVKGKVAYRVCPDESDHEYTPKEREYINFTGY